MLVFHLKALSVPKAPLDPGRPPAHDLLAPALHTTRRKTAGGVGAEERDDAVVFSSKGDPGMLLKREGKWLWVKTQEAPG